MPDRRLIRSFGAWACGLLLAGCAHDASALRRDVTELFRDGAAARKDVLLRFGVPAHTYEDGRVFTYRFVVKPKVYHLTPLHVYVDSTYNLVVVFDDLGRVVRHSLVHVH